MDINQAKVVLEEIGLQDEVTDDLVDASGVVLEHLETVEVELATYKPSPASAPQPSNDINLIVDGCACVECDRIRQANGLPLPMPAYTATHFRPAAFPANAGCVTRTVSEEPMPWPVAARPFTASQLQSHLDNQAERQAASTLQPAPWDISDEDGIEDLVDLL